MGDINKVVYGNETLIDLTSDTVTENDVLEGVTFHSADGTVRSGNVTVPHNLEDLDNVNVESELPSDNYLRSDGNGNWVAGSLPIITLDTEDIIIDSSPHSATIRVLQDEIDAINSDLPIMAYHNTLCTDACLVDLSGADGGLNKPTRIDSTTNNAPSDLAYGFREVQFYNSNLVVVKVIGQTTSGIIKNWYRYYDASKNPVWSDWFNVIDDMFTYVDVPFSVNCAGANLYYSVLSYTKPSGYSYFSNSIISNSAPHVSMANVQVMIDNLIGLSLYTNYGSSLTITGVIRVLFVRE